jgi:MFS transporter, MHS family, shikimate and dehydroshikimate transport protein
MGLSTGVIGLLPTYASIGAWAPALLVLMRVLQGLGAGAEFGGASTLPAEHAPQPRRGYYTSFAQTGVQIGLVLGTVSFLLVGLLPEEQLLSWAWRVPFLASLTSTSPTRARRTSPPTADPRERRVPRGTFAIAKRWGRIGLS